MCLPASASANAVAVVRHRPQHHVADLRDAPGIAEALQDRGAAGDRLQASAVAAAAERPVLDDDGVPQLTGGAVVPAQHAPVEHEARADPLAHVQVHDVLLAPSGAQARLRERREIRGVVEEDRLPKPPMHDLDDVDACPAAQDAPPGDAPRGPIDRCGDRDAHATQLVHAGFEVGEDVGEQQRCAIQLVVRPMIAGQRHVVLAQHGAVDVGDQDAQVPSGDMDAGDQADRTGEGDQRRPPAAADARGGAQDARAREFFDDVRDGCRGQPRHGGQLHLGQAALLLDRGGHAPPVGFTQ